jgi:hypothetical protein
MTLPHSRGHDEHRLTAVDTDPFTHLVALVFELFHHLGELMRGRDRGVNGEGAFVAFVSLLILVMTPILATGAAEPSQLAQHGVAFTLGTIVWSSVIAVPRQRPRMLHLVRIVLALDLMVLVLAVCGAIQGAEASAFFSELATIAAAHLASALVRLLRVAFDPESLACWEG